jgi:FG-GAP-like repeat
MPVLRSSHLSLRRLLGVAAGIALAATALVAPALPAQAATMEGHDVSWPQCGQDLNDMLGGNQFLIIGLNGRDPANPTSGLPFFPNPCLADQVAWARNHSVPAQAYTMAAFPTSVQLSTYKSQGPWSSSTRAGQLSNVGYAEAEYAVARLGQVGFTPGMVWIDVEPRSAQPWPTGTSAQQRENRYVIEGLMRGLRDSGYSYGLYSYASAWTPITGSWRLPGVPVWVPVGHLDPPTEALDACTKPSFSGGRIYLSQWTDDVWDYDLTCGTYAFTALPMPASTLSGATGDFNGDWNNDLLARVASTGDLRLYAGTGKGTIRSGVRIGTGWNGMSALETPGDFNGDGPLDVMAREASTGYLWLYRGNGTGGWLPRVRVGSGWNGFNAIFGPGDFNGDQRVDILARERSTGYLWLYPGNGTGGWLPRVRVGTGWNGFSALVGPGDFNGDGTADVLARESSTGYLWLYPGNGTGGWKSRVRVGTGWNGLSRIMSPGDLNGDRTADVVARDSSGYLWLYPRSGSGTWLTRVRIGSGWNGINALF